MPVDLACKGKDSNGLPKTYRVRTLLDSGADTNWVHQDVLQYIKYNDLGTIVMQVQVFEGLRKRRYRYVEIFYTLGQKVGTLHCFVTDQLAWHNEVEGLFRYANNQLPGETVIDPGMHCDHDSGSKHIALILGPYASLKLRNKKGTSFVEGDLLFESYLVGNTSGFVFSGLVPKSLNKGIIYSYRITPIIKEHLDAQGLRPGEIDFEPDFCWDRYNLLQNLEFMHSK